jgi:hypothetical protein
LIEEHRTRRARARKAVEDFVRSAASGDVTLMASTFGQLHTDGGSHAAMRRLNQLGSVSRDLKRMASRFEQSDYGGWTAAMRRVGRLESVPRRTQTFFLNAYLDHGDDIRSGCEDLALCDGLRVLLPAYRGKAMKLYRGNGSGTGSGARMALHGLRISKSRVFLLRALISASRAAASFSKRSPRRQPSSVRPHTSTNDTVRRSIWWTAGGYKLCGWSSGFHSGPWE